jgi:hypothetical protein
MNKNLLDKAAQQALSEVLGYDESRIYYLILNKKEQELEKEFSYSKRYRLMKSLFEIGAVGKIKPESQDFFSYILLPPSFLYSNKIDLEIVSYLEKIYLENHFEALNKRFSQIILKDEKILLIFLLKYFMEEEAMLSIDEFKLDFLGKRADKIKVTRRRDRRKIGVIDRKLAFEFVSMFNSNENIGYLSTNKEDNREYVSIIEQEINKI